MNNLFFADGVYHNASNVEDYINEDTAIYGPGRISFAEAIPGLMVSLGFLGTLIGLTTGRFRGSTWPTPNPCKTPSSRSSPACATRS